MVKALEGEILNSEGMLQGWNRKAYYHQQLFSETQREKVVLGDLVWYSPNSPIFWQNTPFLLEKPIFPN